MLDKLKGMSQAAASKAAKSAVAKAKNIKASRSKKKSNDQLIVGLDIGTEFIKALVGRVVGTNEVEIIGVGRVHQNLNDMQAGAISDIASVVDNCDKALNEAEQQAGVSARQAIIGIAGELVQGTTTTVRVSRKESSDALDMEEMTRIIKLVQERAESKAKQQLAVELGGKDVEVRLVNSALVGIEIDGYKVTNPIGFQGRDVVVQLYTAFAPLVHIGALERTAHELDLDLLAVAAEPFAVARSLIGDDPNANMSAVLMDVGGGTTDIAVIDEGGVQGTKMFGIGGRAYTRSIERGLGVEYSKAENLKIAFSEGSLKEANAKAVEEALNKTLDVWISGVELALSEFPKLDQLPHRLLLCGGGSSLGLLMDKLHDSDWYKQLPFTRKPQIDHIQPDEVVGITDKTGRVNDHTYITAMGLLRVGMDTLQQSDSPADSIREKLDRMLRV
ncbi:MAG TPA: cell division FtsA domain-containing protein [Candidatus Binatia bacterium]|jgi:cell division protein FtsA|nr:cell division FtsA domain-containing protein [Candidatus Binatia bacterium]